jgi:hypothetical protein
VKPRIASPEIDRRVIADMRAGMSDFMTDDRRWTEQMEREYDDALRKTTLYALASLTYAMQDVGAALVATAKDDVGKLLRLLYGGTR